jgi:uncharacterized protein involved in high-affinity Fe2+ transport
LVVAGEEDFVLRRWAGPLITILILGGVALILVANLDLKGGSTSPGSVSVPTAIAPSPSPPQPTGGVPIGFREYPIGEEQVRHHIRIAAVWLPPVMMEGMGDLPGSDVIHLEADVRATEGNPNGFAKDEFVPYLKVRYRIEPAGGGKPLHEGDMTPMVARDGLHYGASVAMPKPGRYRLHYHIDPPSAGGLGRHSDPATGVAAWWPPFDLFFDWDYVRPPPSR